MTDSRCQIYLSNQNKEKLVHDGYAFFADGEGKNGQFYWYCDKSWDTQTINGRRRKRRMCKKRLITLVNDAGDHIALPSTSEHSHDSQPALLDIKVNLTKMKGKSLIV